MTSETVDFFDNLYNLLRVNRPHMGQALALVEEQLQKGLCLSEQKAAQSQLIEVLSLLKTLFSKNQENLHNVAELIRIIETDGMIELPAFAKSLRSFMPPTLATTPGRGGNSGIPASFMGRVGQIFPISDGDSSFSDRVNAALTDLAHGPDG